MPILLNLVYKPHTVIYNDVSELSVGMHMFKLTCRVQCPDIRHQGRQGRCPRGSPRR